MRDHLREACGLAALALLLLLASCGVRLNPPEDDPIPPCATDGGWPACLCVRENSTSCLCRLPAPPAERLCWRPRQ